MDKEKSVEKEKKVNVLYLFILFLAVVMLSVGTAAAYFTLASKEPDDSTQIRTGTLYINYIDGKTISVSDLFPVVEPDLNSDLYVYKKTFSVQSTGSLDQTIDLYIDITNNEFVSNHLMYALYDDNGNKLSSDGLQKSGKISIVSDVYLKSGESKTYTVLIWLKETYDNQNSEQDCSFSGEFDIYAEQIKYE